MSKPPPPPRAAAACAPAGQQHYQLAWIYQQVKRDIFLIQWLFASPTEKPPRPSLLGAHASRLWLLSSKLEATW